MRDPGEEGQSWFPGLLSIGLALLLASTIIEIASDPTAFSLWVLARTLLKELSVAVLIGWLISIGIERSARAKDAKDAEERRQAIAENVVKGVFGVQYPVGYVQTVIEANLRPSVIRETYRASYSVRVLAPEEVARLDVAAGRFVAFSAKRSFRLRNVSSKDVDYPVASSIPVRRAPKLREFTKIRAAAFNGAPISDAEIAAALNAGDPMDEHLTYKWIRRISADESLDVAFDSIMIKELSDNELWCNAIPTTSGVDFSVQVVPGMRFGLEALTSSGLRRELVSESEGTGTWKIDGPILSNESVVFWWRSPEDDGEPARAMSEPLDRLAVKPAETALPA